MSIGRVCIPPGRMQCLYEESAYHRGDCSVYRKSDYIHGGRDVYRKSLNTTREAAGSIGRV